MREIPPFACPAHKIELSEGLVCPACGKEYPQVDGVPILLNEATSVFRISDYLARKEYGGASTYAGHLDDRSGLRQLYRRAVFRISEAGPPRRDFSLNDAIDLILLTLPEAAILVIGAGDSEVRGNATYTDVAFGKNIQCIADAHDLPFPDRSFDACVAVAVLEHVVDPHRCVDEIRRVLKPNGFVFSETPFMQPVHMGAHDFTRFTHLGHRRLFRHFEEIRSGIAGGPGVSAAQLFRYALASLSDRPVPKKWLKLIGLLMAFPIRWIDCLCYENRGAYDSASGFYFLGRLGQSPMSDRDLLSHFRGG